MQNVLQRTQSLGQSIWYDNIRRGMLASGEMQKLIDQGVTGITSNPTIFEKAVAGSTDYDSALLAMAQQSKPAPEIFWTLAIEDIATTADLLRPVYQRTGGADGFVSLEVSPHLANDTQGTIAEAKRLFEALDRPNVMVKVPATPQGIPTIRRLIAQGINVNVTLIFSVGVYRQVADAYISGLEDLANSGGDVSRVSSVASFFVSRVDTAVDGLLEAKSKEGRDDLERWKGTAAISNARLAYRTFKETFGGARFAALKARGARVQRPLWASTGTKDPTYSDVMYVENLIGPDTVNTMPPATLTAFMDHGRAEATLDTGIEDAQRAMKALEEAGVDMDQITSDLLAQGVKSFADSFDKLMSNIEEKKARLLAKEHAHSGVSLEEYVQGVEATIERLRQDDIVPRIWRKDHTVWRDDPTEIKDRLGWLFVTDQMCEYIPALRSFASEIREAGYRHVVLLGMGGSSLGPEALRQIFGSAEGYPELIVLDSTVPRGSIP